MEEIVEMYEKIKQYKETLLKSKLQKIINLYENNNMEIAELPEEVYFSFNELNDLIDVLKKLGLNKNDDYIVGKNQAKQGEANYLSLILKIDNNIISIEANDWNNKGELNFNSEEIIVMGELFKYDEAIELTELVTKLKPFDANILEIKNNIPKIDENETFSCEQENEIKETNRQEEINEEIIEPIIEEIKQKDEQKENIEVQEEIREEVEKSNVEEINTDIYENIVKIIPIEENIEEGINLEEKTENRGETIKKIELPIVEEIEQKDEQKETIKVQEEILEEVAEPVGEKREYIELSKNEEYENLLKVIPFKVNLEKIVNSVEQIINNKEEELQEGINQTEYLENILKYATRKVEIRDLNNRAQKISEEYEQRKN